LAAADIGVGVVVIGNRARAIVRYIFSQSGLLVSFAKGAGHSIIGDPRPAVTQYVSQHQINEGTYPALAILVRDVGDQVEK